MLNIKEAIGFLDKCKTIIEKNYSNLNLELIFVYEKLGVLHCLDRNLKKSIEYYEKCKKLSEIVDYRNEEWSFELYDILFSLYEKTNDYDKLNKIYIELTKNSLMKSFSALFPTKTKMVKKQAICLFI